MRSKALHQHRKRKTNTTTVTRPLKRFTDIVFRDCLCNNDNSYGTFNALMIIVFTVNLLVFRFHPLSLQVIKYDLCSFKIKHYTQPRNTILKCEKKGVVINSNL